MKNYLYKNMTWLPRFLKIFFFNRYHGGCQRLFLFLNTCPPVLANHSLEEKTKDLWFLVNTIASTYQNIPIMGTTGNIFTRPLDLNSSARKWKSLATILLAPKNHIYQLCVFFFLSVCCHSYNFSKWTPCLRCFVWNGTTIRTICWRSWTICIKRRHFMMWPWPATTPPLSATKWFCRLAHCIFKPCSRRTIVNTQSSS